MVKVHVTAVGFFLGSDDMMGLKHTILINKKTKSRMTQYQKAVNAVKKRERKKNKREAFNFSALQMLNDPQAIFTGPDPDSQDLLNDFSRDSATQAAPPNSHSFRLQLMNLITRLISAHKLLLLQYYDFKEVMSILAYTAQATHELVPPDAIQTVVQGAMNGARALLALYREVNPHMLMKNRGKTATMSLKDFEAQQYGGVRVASRVDVAELLRAREEAEEMKIGRMKRGTGCEGVTGKT
ncbi:hypothetical protein BJ742DRAFT_743980 [Cladochytrium replicatum]|nr:hypothetical protein BJ742DRAFT_743980 [Cladochytrium replicatum]